MAFEFELLATDPDSGLRAGILHTPHGDLPTPAFMPVGTLASVKALTPRDVASTGAHCVLGNTYHLAQTPGAELVARQGGLHGFMRWDGPILTDSGGFQVFSLRGLREIDDDGATFYPPDGSPAVRLTPESVIRAEELLGADLIMPLDECVSAAATRVETERALERTQRWWGRAVAARTRGDQALFALVQGGLHEDLRRESARAAAGEETAGFAIGGFSIGEAREITRPLLAATLAELPADRPRYLMGVGTPSEVLEYSRLGVDMFDCVLPTRLARTGTVWLNAEGARLDLAKAALLAQDGPLVEGCLCLACRGWPRGALAAMHHSGDQLVHRLLSLHNLTMLAEVLRRERERLLARLPNAGAAGVSFTLGE